MNKREVAHVLRVMGKLLAVKGEEAFKVRSYERAADSIMAGDYDLAGMAKAGRLLEIPNIGRNLEPKVRELILTGRSSFLERLTEEIPAGILDLLNVPGIGARTARLLYDSLGVKDLASLRAAISEHKVQALPGLGKKREELMAKGLDEIEKYAGRINLGLVLPLLDSLVLTLSELGIRSAVAGEARRFEETVGRLDLVMECRDHESPGDLIVRSGLVFEDMKAALQEAWDPQSKAFVLRTSFGVPLWVHVASHEDFAVRLMYATGPESYLRFMEKRAGERGYRLDAGGLFKGDERLELEGEAEIHDFLDMDDVPPEVRHRPEMAQAAAVRSLPQLVSVSDLRGDLHVHTTWSDGVASVEAMVQKAAGLGHSYIAITDHATPIKMIRGITAERLDDLIAEVRRVAAAYPRIRVLAGIEVDILKDGKLYLSDECLQKLDLVIASVHQDLGDSRGDLLRRLTEAARNPHVDVIGHPTGRLIGRRPGVKTGLMPLFEAASKHGTVLEISSSSERLDLPEPLVRDALRLGCLFSVSTDAHSPEGLESLSLGVNASARRAGLPPQAVVNTSPDPLSRLKGS
jgi:DNA polymerase (family 10)